MRTVVCTLALLALVCPAFGQSQSASLTGIVTDSSGAAVPRAPLRLVNAETGEVYRASSHDGGNYDFPLLWQRRTDGWLRTRPDEHGHLDPEGIFPARAPSPGIPTEILNFLNHANFANPNVSQGNAAFGQINSLVAGNQSRIVQLGLHYRF